MTINQTRILRSCIANYNNINGENKRNTPKRTLERPLYRRIKRISLKRSDLPTYRVPKIRRSCLSYTHTDKCVSLPLTTIQDHDPEAVHNVTGMRETMLLNYFLSFHLKSYSEYVVQYNLSLYTFSHFNLVLLVRKHNVRVRIQIRVRVRIQIRAWVRVRVRVRNNKPYVLFQITNLRNKKCNQRNAKHKLYFQLSICCMISNQSWHNCLLSIQA